MYMAVAGSVSAREYHVAACAHEEWVRGLLVLAGGVGTCAGVACVVLGTSFVPLPQRGACQGMGQALEARLHVLAALAAYLM